MEELANNLHHECFFFDLYSFKGMPDLSFWNVL